MPRAIYSYLVRWDQPGKEMCVYVCYSMCACVFFRLRYVYMVFVYLVLLLLFVVCSFVAVDAVCLFVCLFVLFGCLVMYVCGSGRMNIFLVAFSCNVLAMLHQTVTR